MISEWGVTPPPFCNRVVQKRWLISHYDFGMKRDPPFFYLGKKFPPQQQQQQQQPQQQQLGSLHDLSAFGRR